MTTLRKAWVSAIEYRPNPTRRELVIPLGVAVEVLRENVWFVGMVVRGFLREVELKRLDSIGRELLSHPLDVLKSEMEHVLVDAHEPGDALRLFAERLRWSIHARRPEEIAAAELTKLGSLPDDDVVRRVFGEWVVWTTDHEAEYPEDQSLPAAAPWASPPWLIELPRRPSIDKLAVLLG